MEVFFAECAIFGIENNIISNSMGVMRVLTRRPVWAHLGPYIGLLILALISARQKYFTLFASIESDVPS